LYKREHQLAYQVLLAVDGQMTPLTERYQVPGLVVHRVTVYVVHGEHVACG
jgi:hypothetical protein